MNKFPVFKTIKNSFAFIFENRRDALEVTWPYALILIAVISIMSYYPEAKDAFWIAIWPLTILAFVMVGLPWQGIYLLGSAPQNQQCMPHINSHKWYYRIIYTIFLICFIAASFCLLLFPTTLSIYIVGYEYGLFDKLMMGLTMGLIPISLPLIFMFICARFLPYLSALAIGNPISVKDSFRLSKGGAIRLSLLNTATVMLLSVLLAALRATAGLWNFDKDYESLKIQLADWFKTSDMPAHAQERILRSSAFYSTESFIDFLLLWPLPIILGLLFSLVITSNIAQFYKWVIENRR